MKDNGMAAYVAGCANLRGAPNWQKPLHGLEILALIPTGSDEWAVAVKRDDKAEYVGFVTNDLTRPHWGQGYYFNRPGDAIRWVAERAGFGRLAEVNR